MGDVLGENEAPGRVALMAQRERFGPRLQRLSDEGGQVALGAGESWDLDEREPSRLRVAEGGREIGEGGIRAVARLELQQARASSRLTRAKLASSSDLSSLCARAVT